MRHLYTLELGAEENFILSPSVCFFGAKKVTAFKSSIDLYFHLFIIEFF